MTGHLSKMQKGDLPLRMHVSKRSSLGVHLRSFKLGVRYYGMPHIWEKQYRGSLNKTMDDLEKNVFYF